MTVVFLDLYALSGLRNLWHASTELEPTATSLSVGIDAIIASNALSATQFGISEEEELLLLPHCSKLYQF